jgi:hypothetical protein
MQLLLEVPVGHVPHCHVVVARAVATAGRGDRSGGRSTWRRRTYSPASREAESRSSLPRRASRRGNPHPNRAGGARILELVLHSAVRPKILEGCSYLRPIIDKAATISLTSRTPISRDDNRRRSTQIDVPKVGSNRIQSKPLSMLNATVAIVGLHLRAEIAPRRTASKHLPTYRDSIHQLASGARTLSHTSALDQRHNGIGDPCQIKLRDSVNIEC